MQFSQLFAGRTDCYGIYKVEEKQANGKRKGRGITYPNSKYPNVKLTEVQYQDHLAGKKMLGIVPVLPTGECHWFAIDIDDYSLDHQRIVKDVERLELPLVVARSKSGGAHLYCFIKGTIDAHLAVQLGKQWAEQLGYGMAEIFPKQVKFDDETAKGNWIILPYFGGNDAVDYAYGMNGERLTIDEFCQWASAKRLRPVEADNYKKAEGKGKTPDLDDILKESPPCVVKMLTEGIGEGGRNNALSHFCVYYQKLDEYFDTDTWADKVNALNSSQENPLPFFEVEQIIKNHKHKKYQYRCKEQPMCHICDKETCLKRKFGVGDESFFTYGEIQFDEIIKINSDPPVWILGINGKKVSMDTETLLSPRKFKMKVFDAINVLVPGMKQKHHDDVIRNLIDEALIVEEADEITNHGKILSTFQEWIENTINRSKSRNDISKGLPYFDSRAGEIQFRPDDFFKQYRKQHKDNSTDRQIFSVMRDMGFERKQTHVKKKRVWISAYKPSSTESWFTIEDSEEKF